MNDHIIAPQRKVDIPLFDEVEKAVMKNGAYNYDISGSGPSSFSFFDDADSARKAGDAIELVLSSEAIDCDIEVTRIDNHGARILEV
jgi:homoserine kinase